MRRPGRPVHQPGRPVLDPGAAVVPAANAGGLGCLTGPGAVIFALFVIVRIAYVFTYVGNRPALRSILWALGLAINIAIFFMPAIKGWLPA